MISSDEDHALATYGNLTVVVWKHETRPDVLKRLRQVVGEAAAQHRERGIVVVLRPDAVLPKPAVRDELRAMCRDVLPGMACVAYVAEHEGFTGAVYRSLITSLMLVMARNVNVRVFPTVQRAALWLGDCLGPADGLADAVGRMSNPRRQHELEAVP